MCFFVSFAETRWPLAVALQRLNFDGSHSLRCRSVRGFELPIFCSEAGRSIRSGVCAYANHCAYFCLVNSCVLQPWLCQTFVATLVVASRLHCCWPLQTFGCVVRRLQRWALTLQIHVSQRTSFTKPVFIPMGFCKKKKKNHACQKTLCNTCQTRSDMDAPVVTNVT